MIAYVSACVSVFVYLYLYIMQYPHQCHYDLHHHCTSIIFSKILLPLVRFCQEYPQIAAVDMGGMGILVPSYY